MSEKEKPCEEWTNIRAGFSDLSCELDPYNPDCEVDKLIEYILDLNILVRNINVKYSYVSEMKKQIGDVEAKDVKVGRYSAEEKQIIQGNWKRLIEKADIIDPAKCLDDLMKPYVVGLRRKRNVLGCYLAQDLPFARHCADVFRQCTIVLQSHKKGKFTKKEDEMIIAEVATNGANNQTWSRLATKMNRLPKDKVSYNIKIHYAKLMERQKWKKGSWTTIDYEIFLDFVFTTSNLKKEQGPEYIKTLPVSVIREAAKLLERDPHNVVTYWKEVIQPALLSYHYGYSHSECRKRFYEYLVSKKVNYVQEIDWNEAVRLFPSHSPESLSKFLIKYRSYPVWQTIQDKLPVMMWKERESKGGKIVALYNQICDKLSGNESLFRATRFYLIPHTCSVSVRLENGNTSSPVLVFAWPD